MILGYGEMILTTTQPNDSIRESAREIVKAGERAASITRQFLAFARKQSIVPVALDLNDAVKAWCSRQRGLLYAEAVLAGGPRRKGQGSA